MIAVQVSPRKKVYVSFCDDTFPNKGGFYCQVYADDGCEFEIDNFVVDKEYLRSAKDDYEKRYRLAEKIARDEVKCRFK